MVSTFSEDLELHIQSCDISNSKYSVSEIYIPIIMKMVCLELWFLLCGLLCPTIQAARILVYLPLSTWSHYMQYELLYETLTSRGHHITMYSPYPPKHNVTNFSHVFVENQAFNNILAHFDFFKECQDMRWFFIEQYQSLNIDYEINKEIVSDSIFRELLTSKQSYDLVILEPLFLQEVSLLLGHHFQAPVISVSAVGANTNLLDAMHSPNLPSFMPEMYSYMTDEMTLLQRIQNWHYSAVFYIYRLVRNWTLDNLIADKIGPGYPSVESMLKNISFSLLYSNPGLEYAKPLTSNMVQVGCQRFSGHTV